MKLCMLDKYPHWSEVLSVITYADNPESKEIPFVSRKWLSEDEYYVDPLGKKYTNTVTSGYAANEDRVLLINGDIHLDTHPLNKGKIPYVKLKNKLAIEHTTGYSPWDFTHLIDLVRISLGMYENDNEDSCGSNVIYAMNKKCYDRFIKVDWNAFGRDYYAKYIPLLENFVAKGRIIPTAIEPSQFWLENVSHSKDLELSDHICLCLNWCNLDKAEYVKNLAVLCEKLHKYTGRDIDIKTHPRSRDSFLLSHHKHIDYLPYVHIIPGTQMSKYDLMDKYNLYFVDGTGLGYETAYRNYYNNRDVDIFYISGLPSDEKYHGFDGVPQMGAIPMKDQNDFLSGVDKSNYPIEVIKEGFPHTPGNVPNECYEILTNLSERFRDI